MFRGLVLAVAIVGLVAVGLVGGQQTAEAQQTASATRSLPSEVESGGTLTVTITVANYGGIGQLTEEFPGDFTFEGSSPAVTPSGQTLTFNLLADASVSYTLTAPATTETISISGFSGTLEPAVGDGVGVSGPSSVTVSSPPAQPTASATRSFSPFEVEPDSRLVVTIRVADYGGIGQLTETFHSDFTFVESSPAVTPSGQTLTFNLLADTSVSYTLTAPATTGRRSGFLGNLEPAEGDGVTVGGPSGVQVRRPSPPPPPPPPPPVPANRDPVFSDGSSTTRSIDENSASGANVGAAVRAGDADGDRLTYSLTGTDAGSFTINSSTGQIMVGTGTMLDFEDKASYTVTARVTDGSASDRITVNITVTNVDDMGEVTFWVGSVALTMPPQVDEAITGLVVDPDGGVMGETWQWAKSMDKTDMNSWMDIQGATDAMYTPMAADDGYYLQVTAMYEDAEGAGKTAMGMTGSAVGATGGALAMYDADKNGSIDKSEYQAAAEHYLRDTIDKATFQEVAELYLRG